MNWREFSTLIAGAAAASLMWPRPLRAQATIRRVGLLSPLVEDTAENGKLKGVFIQRLSELGWNVGRNFIVEERWSGGDQERLQSSARELASLRAEVILGLPHRRSLCSSRRRPPFPSYSSQCPIRSAADSSKACHGPAATSPASSISKDR